MVIFLAKYPPKKLLFWQVYFTKLRPGNCLLPQTHPRDKQRVEVQRPVSASRTADVRIARSKNCPQTAKSLKYNRHKLRDHKTTTDSRDAAEAPCLSISRNLSMCLMTFAFHQSPPTHYPLRSLDGRRRTEAADGRAHKLGHSVKTGRSSERRAELDSLHPSRALQ